jgi:nicotinamidase-related amidase
MHVQVPNLIGRPMSRLPLNVSLTPRSVHLCIDMQRMFSSDGIWPTPWMVKVLPVVEEIAGRFPERTVFTRFIPPIRAGDMPGMWQRYYTRWIRATRERINPELLELLPSLSSFAPPAAVIDKSRYSAFAGSTLLRHLQDRKADALIITGSETDVCVLATVLAAVDIGFPVIVVEDAICSSSNTGHDALMTLYHQRYSEQIETASAETILLA